MNGFKKIMSTTLAAAMVAGCGTLTFANNYDDVKNDHEAQTEISILTDIGVIKGTHENKFSPDENVSREQMATLLFRLMLGRDDAGRVNTTKFTDLYEPYYNGAISWANAAGYILGTSATTFNPKGGITKQDAMAMLVRALGQDSEKMNAGYPWSYINAGIKLGLDRGLDGVAYDETLTRAETAVILYNALTAEYLISKNTQSGNVYYESTSVIEEVFGYSMAHAQLVSTNDYTLEDNTVVKNGYVTLLCETDSKSFYMTVKADDLDLDGDANDYIGQSFRVIYGEEKDRYTVLSAVPFTKTESFDTVKLNNDKNTVEIGGSHYTLVEEYSDELSTNNNELMLYAYDGDGELERIETNAELSELLGFYRVTLMFDGGSETAKRGLIRVFEMDELSIEDGKVNIADNKKEADLNIRNDVEAEEGDYVLYYYNSRTMELEIAEILDIEAGTVKRITNSSAKIGNNTYDLGNATAGISAESIRNKLSLGNTASVVLYKDAIVAVIEGVTISDSSRYLTALSDAHRIYEDGSFRYVLTAFIDGEERNIYVKDGSAKEGKVYRYTERSDVYTLMEPTVEDGIIISGRHEFIQSADGLDEIAYMIENAKNSTIELGGRNYYTMNKGEGTVLSSVAGLDNIRFVCDKNTVIVVNENGRIMVNDPYEPNYDKWDLAQGFFTGFDAYEIVQGYSGAWIYDKSAMPEDPFIYREPMPDPSNARYPHIELTLEEKRLLARVVWVEARGECDEGQQAVAEVVLNRMASNSFPDTLREVIYAEGQFRSVPYLDEAEPYQAQYKAIERAMYGPYVLPEEVVHFAGYKTTDYCWGQIGGHYFCYDWDYIGE